MLVIEVLLMRCFVDSWLLDITPIFLTSMSIVAMVSSYISLILSNQVSAVGYVTFKNPLCIIIVHNYIIHIPAFIPRCRMFYFVLIWLVEKIKTQHHLWGIGSYLKNLNLKDGANSSQSETACKN